MNPFVRSGSFMLVMAWLLIMGGLYWFFSGWHSAEINPNTANVLTQQQGDLTLLRNRDGHYVASGTINGRPVRFLLDTGATWVVVSMGMAAELGLKRGAALTLQTANGPTVGYQTRLARIQVGSLELKDVGAVISDGIDDNVVLLGMSFLNRVEFSQRNGVLTLRPSSAGR
jgi:aspartyl protease family protein